MRKILCFLIIFACFSFAAEANVSAPEKAVAVSDSVAAVDSASVSADSAAASKSVENELRAEIAMRDSVMTAQNEICSAEKDTLRSSIEVEKAKSANWEQSYNTIKKNNELCAQALATSIGVNEKKKEKEDEDRRQAAMMTSTSFIGGLGIGMLLFWLIFD